MCVAATMNGEQAGLRTARLRVDGCDFWRARCWSAQSSQSGQQQGSVVVASRFWTSSEMRDIA